MITNLTFLQASTIFWWGFIFGIISAVLVGFVWWKNL